MRVCVCVCNVRAGEGVRVCACALRVQVRAGVQEKPKNRARACVMRPHPLEKKQSPYPLARSRPVGRAPFFFFPCPVEEGGMGGMGARQAEGGAGRLFFFLLRGRLREKKTGAPAAPLTKPPHSPHSLSPPDNARPRRVFLSPPPLPPTHHPPLDTGRHSPGRKETIQLKTRAPPPPLALPNHLSSPPRPSPCPSYRPASVSPRPLPPHAALPARACVCACARP